MTGLTMLGKFLIFLFWNWQTGIQFALTVLLGFITIGDDRNIDPRIIAGKKIETIVGLKKHVRFLRHLLIPKIGER